LEEVHATDGSGSRISHSEERVSYPAALPSTGKAGEGTCAGGVSRLCAAGDAQASAEAEWLRVFAGASTETVAEIGSVDIVRPTIEGREIWLRRIARLDEEQQRILHQLQLQLPERLEPIQFQKCSADSAIA
jgi:hypothetical protein